MYQLITISIVVLVLSSSSGIATACSPTPSYEVFRASLGECTFAGNVTDRRAQARYMLMRLFKPERSLGFFEEDGRSGTYTVQNSSISEVDCKDDKDQRNAVPCQAVFSNLSVGKFYVKTGMTLINVCALFIYLIYFS